jgi:two-component system, LytTR family, response regulator
MRKQLTAVIVDDERLARQKLLTMLAKHSEIAVVGEADGVLKAIEIIERMEPEVLFLDVQMPGASGFELLDRISNAVKVVFVTAFDEYAIRAFEVNAFDYLLKPINPERLAQSIERLFVLPESNPKVSKPLEYEDHLFLSVGEHSTFLKVSSIKCIYAEGVYSEVQMSDNTRILIHKSLKEWEERLPAKYFTRIHRGAIVNIEYIERTERMFNYSYHVFMRNIAEPLVMSRRYAAKLKNKLS